VHFARALLRVQRHAGFGVQVDAKKGAEAVMAIWLGPQRHAMHLDRRQLASCSLVRRQMANETGVQR